MLTEANNGISGYKYSENLEMDKTYAITRIKKYLIVIFYNTIR